MSHIFAFHSLIKHIPPVNTTYVLIILTLILKRAHLFCQHVISSVSLRCGCIEKQINSRSTRQPENIWITNTSPSTISATRWHKRRALWTHQPSSVCHTLVRANINNHGDFVPMWRTISRAKFLVSHTLLMMAKSPYGMCGIQLNSYVRWQCQQNPARAVDKALDDIIFELFMCIQRTRCRKARPLDSAVASWERHWSKKLDNHTNVKVRHNIGPKLRMW